MGLPPVLVRKRGHGCYDFTKKYQNDTLELFILLQRKTNTEISPANPDLSEIFCVNKKNYTLEYGRSYTYQSLSTDIK